MKIKRSFFLILVFVLIGSSFIALNENFRYLNLISECSEEEDKTETEIEVHKSLFIRFSRKKNPVGKRVSQRSSSKGRFIESAFSESQKSVDQFINCKPINELYILYCSLKLDLV